MTISNPEFVDEKFEVVPVFTQTHQSTQDQRPPGPVESTEQTDTGPCAYPSTGIDFTEEEVFFISETVANLPCIIYPKIPFRTEEQIKPFNHQLYLYCRKKGINPFEYLFDELGLVLAGAGLAGGIYRDYQDNYSKNGKVSEKEKKLNADYDHAQEIAKETEVKT